MYGTHVTLVDMLTSEAHDALVVGEQWETPDGPKNLLTLAYVRKEGPRHAMHEHRILYRNAVRPASHPDVQAGKFLHFYKVPDGSVGIGNSALLYSLFLDGSQLNTAAPADELVGLLTDRKRTNVSISTLKVGDVLCIGPFPEGSTVIDVVTGDAGTMVNVLAASNPKAAPPASVVAIDGVNNFPTQDAGEGGDPAPVQTTEEQAAPAEEVVAQ